MTTIHKTYNPKTASVTDIYHVDDDGHDRWFIPMLEDTETDTGPATMDQQLAQCKKLSPHGVGKDETPDLPLELTQVGSVTGNLMMGGAMVGNVAKAKNGAKPYTVTVQKQVSLDKNTWTDRGSTETPDENWQVTWTNGQNDGGMYWRIVTVITDVDMVFITNISDAYGPVQVLDPWIYGPDPSTVSLPAGGVTRQKWNGSGAYNFSFSMEIAEESTAFTGLNVNTDYADLINSSYPDAQFFELKWEVTSPGWIQLSASRLATASVDMTFKFKGIVTDTYQSKSDEAEAILTLNLT